MKNKKIWWFLLRFFGTYFFLFLGYSFLLLSTQSKAPHFESDPITQHVAKSTEWLLNVWDANAPSEVTIVLQNASGTDIGTAVAGTTTPNTWEDINFDFSDIPDAAGVSKVVILFDAGNQADSNQVYYFDNLRMEGLINSITEINSNEINVYPNPTSDYLMVDVADLNTEALTISVLSIDGKLIKKLVSKNKSNNVQINVSDLTAGFYILEVASQNKKHLTKFIKK